MSTRRNVMVGLDNLKGTALRRAAVKNICHRKALNKTLKNIDKRKHSTCDFLSDKSKRIEKDLERLKEEKLQHDKEKFVFDIEFGYPKDMNVTRLENQELETEIKDKLFRTRLQKHYTEISSNFSKTSNQDTKVALRRCRHNYKNFGLFNGETMSRRAKDHPLVKRRTDLVDHLITAKLISKSGVLPSLISSFTDLSEYNDVEGEKKKKLQQTAKTVVEPTKLGSDARRVLPPIPVQPVREDGDQYIPPTGVRSKDQLPMNRERRNLWNVLLPRSESVPMDERNIATINNQKKSKSNANRNLPGKPGTFSNGDSKHGVRGPIDVASRRRLIAEQRQLAKSVYKAQKPPEDLSDDKTQSVLETTQAAVEIAKQNLAARKRSVRAIVPAEDRDKRKDVDSLATSKKTTEEFKDCAGELTTKTVGLQLQMDYYKNAMQAFRRGRKDADQTTPGGTKNHPDGITPSLLDIVESGAPRMTHTQILTMVNSVKRRITKPTIWRDLQKRMKDRTLEPISKPEGQHALATRYLRVPDSTRADILQRTKDEEGVQDPEGAVIDYTIHNIAQTLKRNREQGFLPKSYLAVQNADVGKPSKFGRPKK